MKKKPTSKDLKAPTKQLFDLLKRASQPLYEVKVQKRERKKRGDYIDKRTRQRKAEDVED
jgi:hypothetical protein